MSIMGKFRKFIDDSKRVMSISYKPSSEEFNKSAKIILIGILLIGVIGFIIAIIISLVISGSLSLI